jgi:hypothetical protein
VFLAPKLRSYAAIVNLDSVDPENNPTPPEFEGVHVQYLGDKETWYRDDYLQGCVDFYKPSNKDNRCLMNEKERVEMSLRQPQSMVVSSYLFRGCGFRSAVLLMDLFLLL